MSTAADGMHCAFAGSDNAAPNLADEPEIPCEPYKPDNTEFMAAVFHSLPDGARPGYVSFTGNPHDVPRKAWWARPWAGGELVLSPAANNYFSISSYHNDDSGQFRRTKRTFVALHAIMLDDIGTKVDRDRVSLPMSWLIETSPGNHQGGYIVAAPIEDAPTADRLTHAIIAAGLCDPGASGPTARLARLPVGVNGKHVPIEANGALGEPFRCRLIEWHPARRYTTDELVAGLEIELAPAGRPKPARKSRQSVGATMHAADEVYVPAPSENPVLAELRAHRLYKVPLGAGKHDITCPWRAEHTASADNGTAYFEPDDTYPLGGFRCLHSHGDRLHIRELLAHLGISPASAKMKPTVRVAAGELHRVVDRAESLLARDGRLYQRGGLIVMVHTDPGTRETAIRAVSPSALTRALAQVAMWERFDKRSDDWVVCDPPERHTRVLFDAMQYDHLPVLAGIARQPYLRPDGTLMMQAGYDPATGMFGAFAEHVFEVPARPTRQDAEAALQALDRLIVEFRFRDDKHDRSAALSGILTATVRPSLPLAPMFHVRAPQPSSGKSYQRELLTAFATPQKGTPTAFPRDDEECRKLLLAELLSAPAVIEFDNMTGDLIAHKSLCIALTSEFISGRILGVSKTATAGTRALFLSSGNNVGPVGDMTRRTVTVHLDPKCEKPVEIKHARQPVAEVRADRGRYVSLALTMVRAWIVAGRPRTECRALATYTLWDELCRQPLLWLGRADPAHSVFEGMAHDPDREILGQLLTAWRSAFGDKPVMVRDAVKAAAEGGKGELREAMTDIAGEGIDINRERLGRWIARCAGRIVGGLKFEKASGARSAAAWQAKSGLSGFSGAGDASTKNGNDASPEEVF